MNQADPNTRLFLMLKNAKLRNLNQKEQRILQEALDNFQWCNKTIKIQTERLQETKRLLEMYGKTDQNTKETDIIDQYRQFIKMQVLRLHQLRDRNFDNVIIFRKSLAINDRSLVQVLKDYKP